jgi:hypothetical protein
MLTVTTGGMAIAGGINPISRNAYSLGDSSGNYWNGVYSGTAGFIAYNLFTDASNYESVATFWAGNVACIGTQAAGTGTLRRVRILAGDGVLELTNSGATDFNLLRFGSAPVHSQRCAVTALVSRLSPQTTCPGPSSRQACWNRSRTSKPPLTRWVPCLAPPQLALVHEPS